jgi:hypothetical protein
MSLPSSLRPYDSFDELVQQLRELNIKLPSQATLLVRSQTNFEIVTSSSTSPSSTTSPSLSPPTTGYRITQEDLDRPQTIASIINQGFTHDTDDGGDEEDEVDEEDGGDEDDEVDKEEEKLFMHYKLDLDESDWRRDHRRTYDSDEDRRGVD